MKLSEYKSALLAREDVDDIVRLEPIEMRPNANKTEYVQVVHTTETGKKITKYDVHLMRTEGGVKRFEKESIAVINEGQETEEVMIVSSTARATRIASKLERYINRLPYLNVADAQVDPEAKTARFTALKDNENGTASEVEVFAYLSKGADGVVVEKHVEILK